MPTRHRDVLTTEAQGQITITKHPHGCLMLFPRPEWLQFRERIAQLPMSAQWWKRILLGNAQDVDMDSTGRVLVAPELREAVGLDKEATLIGNTGYFEVWDAKRREEARKAVTLAGLLQA